MDEGYIKFNCYWECAEFNYDVLLMNELIKTRDLLRSLGFIGMLDNGIGYGNISVRHQGSFLISGSATGHIEHALPEHFALVNSFNIEHNEVFCTGHTKASSESMSHAALYEVSSEIQAVIHIHHKNIWALSREKLPSSRSGISYGTPEMARELQRLFSVYKRNADVFRLEGHEDGLIGFAKSLSEASDLFINLHKTYSHD